MPAFEAEARLSIVLLCLKSLRFGHEYVPATTLALHVADYNSLSTD